MTKNLAIFKINMTDLHRMLDLPENIEIVSVHSDFNDDQLYVKIMGIDLPLVIEGMQISVVNLEVTQHLLSLENECLSPPSEELLPKDRVVMWRTVAIK